MRLNFLPWPLAAGALLGLSACNTTSAPAAEPAGKGAPQVVQSGHPPRNQCHANAAQFLVGQPYAADTLQRALAAAGADEARMLPPNAMTTKEYKTGRLNVVLDEAGRVARVHCG